MQHPKAARQSIAALTTAIAALVACVVALVPPVSYFWAAYSATQATIAAEAQINARLVAQIVDQNPLHWQLEEAHLSALLSKRPNDHEAETRRVLDERGAVVAQSDDSLGALPIRFRAPIYDSGVAVATLEVSRSLQSLAWSTSGVAAVSLALALLGFWGLRVLPMRALQRALDDVAHAKEKAFDATRSKDKAEAEAHLRSMFLANMSHELRTPMNGVLGMLELTLDTPLSAEQREHLALAHQSAKHLLTLLNDILDFSKIDAGMLSVQASNFDLHDLLASVLQAARHRALDKGLTLEQRLDPQLPAMVCADPDRLRQVLVNLVGNAIKFTREGGITLSAKLEHEAGRALVHLQLQDSGIGIEAAKLELIFNAFSQADASTTREFGGTGLGLTISRQLAELMGGHLWATSETGKGSVFHLTVPVTLPEWSVVLPQAAAPDVPNRSVAPVPPSEALAETPRRKAHVLVTDDNEINRRLAGLLLTKQGHHVSYANNGQQALDAVSADVDIILMDVEMPVMGGFEATRLLRQRGCQLPIIALTAHAIDGYREKCLEAGMDEFLTKPISSKLLAQTIEHFAPPWQAGRAALAQAQTSN